MEFKEYIRGPHDREVRTLSCEVRRDTAPWQVWEGKVVEYTYPRRYISLGDGRYRIEQTSPLQIKASRIQDNYSDADRKSIHDELMERRHLPRTLKGRLTHEEIQEIAWNMMVEDPKLSKRRAAELIEKKTKYSFKTAEAALHSKRFREPERSK